MKEIQLTQGKVTIVDDEDYEILNQYKWYANFNSGNYYAMNNKLGSMHRFIAKTPKGLVTDHINHNTLDNRRDNLRVCTLQENNKNRNKRNNTSSKYMGVTWFKVVNKWKSQIKVDKNVIYLGSFSDEKEAAIAYNKAAIQYFGEFANLNEIV